MTDQRRPYYITTAIPYVNAAPHVGFALELVLTDALARHARQRRRDVRFLSGTDENSLKNVRAAEQEGLATDQFVARNAERFRALKDSLELSFDDFIQTASDSRHAPGVSKLWQACEAKGDLYRKSYSGLYCVGCEQFYSEDELDKGRCPEHATPPEAVDEENYFFRLSRYESELLDLLESGRLKVQPESYRRELIAFVKSGLADISVSRSRERAANWGVPVPGDSSQVTYVWFDALGNYVTALDFAEGGETFRRFWAGDDGGGGSGERIHVVGKGITRFHAVYWPAILLSAGLTLPTRLLVHGYLTVDGQKISKSLTGREAADPAQLARRFGADPLRYYFLRHTRPQQDTDFQLERLEELYRGELAGQLGNLVSRVLGFIERRGNGCIPAPCEEPPHQLAALATSLSDRIDDALDRFQVHEAIDEIWNLVTEGNRYIEHAAPWKSSGQEQANVLYHACELIRIVAYHLTPFLPSTADRIRSALGLEWGDLGGDEWGGLKPATELRETPILFPRLEETKR